MTVPEHLRSPRSAFPMGKAKPPKPQQVPDVWTMYQLAERYSEASLLLEEHEARDQWGAFSPRILTDSFAIELYLKCILVCDHNEAPPKKHDLRDLFDRLKSESREGVRASFKQVASRDPLLRNPDVVRLVNPDALRVIDFDRTLDAAARTFERIRYLYEWKSEGEWFYAHILRAGVREYARLDFRILRMIDRP